MILPVWSISPWRQVVAGVVLLLLGVDASNAAGRFALVIGNGAYDHVPALPNPPKDSADIAAALERLGFSVDRLANLRLDDMRKAVAEFGARSRGADLAIVYYAGHGMEVRGENWLIPVDAELTSDLDVQNEAITLKALMDSVAHTSTLALVILDACRDNPFAVKMLHDGKRLAIPQGLARVEPRENIIVAYAAAAGSTADDGHGRNSPFTAALLKHIETPGLEINFLFRNVRADVMQTTRSLQRPAIFQSVSKKQIFLKPVIEAVEPATAPTPARRPDELVWSTIRDSLDPSLFREFRRKFPNSPYVPRAIARLEELTSRHKPSPVDTGELGATDCDRLAASPYDDGRLPDVPGVVVEQIDAAAAIVACDQALARYPRVSRFPHQAGRAAEARKDYIAARRYYENAVKLDHVMAMFNLGRLYDQGLGTPRDYGQARLWYERAAARRSACAMVNLGYLYEAGNGVAQSYAVARDWYEKAAAAGNARAMNNLGYFYEKGLGVDPAYATARRWYEQSAALGDALAMRNLGDLYGSGIGVSKDPVEAGKWYDKAAAASDDKSARVPRTDHGPVAGGSAEPAHLRSVSSTAVDPRM